MWCFALNAVFFNKYYHWDNIHEYLTLRQDVVPERKRNIFRICLLSSFRLFGFVSKSKLCDMLSKQISVPYSSLMPM